MMLLLTLIAILPIDPVIREHVDQIEIQNFYNWHPIEHDKGTDFELRLTFQQILFRRFDWHTAQHQIEAWRMTKGDVYPVYVAAKGHYELRFRDGDVERVVTTNSVVYSSSDGDSELLERALWPKETRTDLAKKLRRPRR